MRTIDADKQKEELVKGETMNDLISRQAAIDALAGMHCKSDEDGYIWIIRSDAWARIDALPSVQPEVIRCKDCADAERMNDLISRQAAIDAFMTATSDGDKVDWCRWMLEQLPAVVPDIYNVICARRDLTWRMYQSNKKMDPSDPHTARLVHEWLTLDSIARLFTDRSSWKRSRRSTT